MTAPLLVRLDAHDRALMRRCAMSPAAKKGTQLGWAAITHLGGTWLSILMAALPGFGCCGWKDISHRALATLFLSHLVVQLFKRAVGRGRPSAQRIVTACIPEPDRFSFPSGHATAGLSVAIWYAIALPLWSAPILVLALIVGFSRVRLGAHYPSDVVAGQMIAAMTALGVYRFF